jgi:anti-anti-sigma factor
MQHSHASARPTTIEVTTLDEGLARVRLAGRLDTPGVDNVETVFVAALVPGSRNAVIDLTDVEFIASMGIRMLITVARSLKLRKAKIALYGAQPGVDEVLATVSLGDVIPVVRTETEALAVVSARA